MIHPLAEVEAPVPDSTSVWRWTHVAKTALIGPNCRIGQGCYIAGIMGAGCKIQNGCNLYDGVLLEDEVFIGPNVTFTNILVPRAGIENKNYRKTIVRQGASIGAGAVIVCGIEIGAYAMVGAGSVVTKNVKSHALVMGNPAKQRKWVACDGRVVETERAALEAQP